MIERSGFIESVDRWSESSVRLSEDVLLCALVSLRLITSEVFQLLEVHTTASDATSPSYSESLVEGIRSQINYWQDRWLTRATAGKSAPARLIPHLLTSD